MKVINLTYQTYTLITSPKIHTDLLWDLTILFAVLGILYFVCVFIFRNKISFKNKKSTLRKRELAPMVSEFLFHEAESTKEENTNYVNLKIEIRELLKEPVNRKLFSEILFDLQKDVSGETLNRLHKLYVDLGLNQDAFAKLKSWKWHVVSKGILELTKMEVPESYGIIKKFINTKKGIIRKQAEIATVSLKHEGINYFLDTTTYKISEWQQLKLLDVLRNFEDFQPPRFKVWFTSNNKDVVLFALRLAKYYNQNDANSSITELIKHKNNQIKTEAIQCIREFNIVEAVEPLKNIFWKCTVSIKLLILGAVAGLGKKEDVIFLQLVANKDSDFTVKSKALGAINTICPESIMPTKGMDKKLADSSWKEVMEFNEKNEEYELVEPEAILDNELLGEDIDTIDDIPEASKEVFDLPIKENIIEDKELVDNVNDIEVFTEEVAHVINEEKETIDLFENVSTDLNIEISIDSSPIHIKSLENTFELDETEHSENINDITVVFEEIVQTNTNSEFDLPLEEVEKDELEKELNFLPIVLDGETDEKIFLQENIEHEIEKESFTNFNEEDISIDFLPFIIDEQEDNVDVSGIDVIYDEIIVDSNNELSIKEELKKQDDLPISPIKEDFDIDFIPIIESSTENKPTKDDTVEIADTTEVVEAVIPKAMFPEMTFDEEAKQLLDDIEEFGDLREVSFLNELLEIKEYKHLSDRIQNILKKFNNDSDSSIPENESLKSFCVFEDLFRICDTEAKLILMDEIVDVGDEKEILFLNRLLQDNNTNISSKAEKLLKELQNKMMLQNILPIENTKTISHEEVSNEYSTLMNELEIKPAEPTNFLDVEFEFTEEVLPTDESIEVGVETNKVRQASFLSHICLFSHKIIDKFNG